MTSSRMTTLLLLKIIDVLDVFNFSRVPPLQSPVWVDIRFTISKTMYNSWHRKKMGKHVIAFDDFLHLVISAVNNAYLHLFSLPLHLKFVGNESKPGALKSHLSQPNCLRTQYSLLLPRSKYLFCFPDSKMIHWRTSPKDKPGRLVNGPK